MKNLFITLGLFSLYILFLPDTIFGQFSISINHQDISCNGANDGSATVVPVGGTGHYSYSWSPSGGNAATANNLGPGTYTVTVVDTISPGNTVNTVYLETFEATHNWVLNTQTGMNGTDPNFWVVSDNEGGVASGGCGVAANGNKTLHIAAVLMPNNGAVYDAGGLCGILMCPQTATRASSPLISTIGHSSLTLSFDYISNGDGLNDNASVWYNAGAGWVLLTPSIKSPVCVGGQGQWTNFSMPLPPACANIPNLQIGINWVNNDDGVGTDPSVAINDVRITSTSTGTPVLQTLTENVTISEPNPIVVNSSASACLSYDFGGVEYSQTGIYSHLFPSVAGCDSLVHLSLTIFPQPNASVNYVNATSLIASGGVSYQWVDCNTNSPISGETNATFDALVNGDYAVVAFSADMCSDTSECLSIYRVSIDEKESVFIQLHPNPVNDILNIVYTEAFEGKIMDISGKVLLSFRSDFNEIKLSLSALKPGLYLVYCKSLGKDGNSGFYKILKN